MHEYHLKQAGQPDLSLGVLSIERTQPRSDVRCVLLASVLRALQATEVPERGIEVVLETDEVVVLFVDALLITSAISNLLRAAIWLARDNARVMLRSNTTDSCVCVELEDGCGGFDATSTVGAERLSLWLTSTQRMARAMNGSVTIEHRGQRGCSFTLALPFRTVD